MRNYVATLRQRVRNEELELDRQLTIRREQTDLLHDRRDRGEIRAPIDGLVTEIRAVHGEFVHANSQPFVVATRGNFLEGRINEEDVGLVASKMNAVVRLYAFAGRDLDAVVAQVLPTGRDQRYTVLLNFVDPPATVLAGMTGEMNIIAGRRENALLIPTRALLGDRVYVVVDGVIAPRQVTVGFRNLEHAEILAGLEPGDAVVVADHDLFTVGQRVRAVAVNRVVE